MRVRKSDLIDFLQEVDGDPEVFIEFFDSLVLVGNMYVDKEGDIIIEK